MGWVDAGGEGTEHHPVGHYGPITKTLSARQWAYQPPFHTSLINWEEWEEEEGKGKGTSLYQPSKCQRMGQAPGLASWIEYTSLRKWEQFKTHCKTHIFPICVLTVEGDASVINLQPL